MVNESNLIIPFDKPESYAKSILPESLYALIKSIADVTVLEKGMCGSGINTVCCFEGFF